MEARHAPLQNPDVARAASAFLQGQRRHVEAQIRHLEEVHALRLEPPQIAAHDSASSA